jgi:nitrate reductase (cytochrome)
VAPFETLSKPEKGPNPGVPSDGFDITRREVLTTLGVLGASVAAGATGWGVLEGLVALRQPVQSWHKSVCRFCGTGCGVLIGMKDGQVVDVRPDELAHNKGVICIKGSMLPELVRIPGRLTTPKIRKNGTLVDASWDEAMGLVASKFSESIREFGPDAVAFYGSGQLFTEESYTANKLFKAGIRTNNVDGNPRLCMASAASGYISTYGKDEPPGCYADADYADCFFIFGANPYECHPPIFERIRQRKRLHPEAVIICVDPRRTMTAQHSDIHMPVVPGTDLLLLNSIANVICEEGLENQQFIKKHVRFSDGERDCDFAQFREFLKAFAPERVELELGVSAGDVRRVAFLFARSRATMSLWTMGANQRTQGTFLNNMLNGLHLITGQIGRPGATPFSVTGQPNACGGVRDTGALAHALPNGRLVANPEHRTQMETLWNVPLGTISPKVGLDAVNLFRAMEHGSVKAVLIMCTNPGTTLPSAMRYEAAMEKCFTVVVDVVEDSETQRHAQVVLPAALWIEKEGVTGQGERLYQLTEKLLTPPGEARSDLQILVDLAERLGHGKLIHARTPEAVWDEWRNVSAQSFYNFQGITYARLRKERGLQWPCPTEDHPGTARRYVEGEDPFVTKGAGIEFYGNHDKKAVVYLRPYVPSPERLSAEYPMYLTTGRILEQFHTGTLTERIPELSAAAGPAKIHINPQDAFVLRISDGDPVEVTSKYGAVRGEAKLSDMPRRGVIFSSFYDAKLLINQAVADNYDPTSKEPEYKVTAVSVRKVTS